MKMAGKIEGRSGVAESPIEVQNRCKASFFGVSLGPSKKPLSALFLIWCG